MNELLNLDITQISYGALFVWLLFDTREKKYQDIIDNFSVNICVINDVKEDVEEIKDIISRGVSNE